MPATLRSLLAMGDFHLRAVHPLSDQQLDRPLAWVHSTDLADPTPWLESGQLLLTNGAQFSEFREGDFGDYCQRLRRLDIAGIGVATEVIHDRVPVALAESAAECDVPLIEVGNRTPFIRIIRTVADIESADRHARLTWSLEAQRAVARAAVRDDGLRGILRTLAQRLHTWVMLFDAAGTAVDLPGIETAPAPFAERVQVQARVLLAKGAAASLRTGLPLGATLQTIGHGGRLRGVLAVGASEPLDTAENDLVGSVIALAGITLEQQRALDASRRQIRTGILELLVAGQLREARRSAEPMWRMLPEPPLQVAVVPGPLSGQSLLDELELIAASASDHLFFAERDDDVVILSRLGATPLLAPYFDRHHLVVGTADIVRWPDLLRGIREAAHAARSTDEPSVVRYESVAGEGFIGLMRKNGGATLSHTLLARLNTLPVPERRRLWDAAHAWLDANTVWEPAARALGVHRHTLRARIDQLQELLELDLKSFRGRAELWAALELADDGLRAALDDA